MTLTPAFKMTMGRRNPTTKAFPKIISFVRPKKWVCSRHWKVGPRSSIAKHSPFHIHVGEFIKCTLKSIKPHSH